MTTPSPSPTIVDFDHHSTEYAASSPGVYEELRERCPVAFSESHDGFWVLSRYADIVEVAKNAVVFSSRKDPGEGRERMRGLLIPEIPGLQRSVTATDPPIFHAYRKLLNPYFSPASAAQREPMIAAIVDECIDEVIESGTADLVRIASLVTVRVILDAVGLPQDDAPRVARTFHDFVSTPPGTPEYAELLLGVQAMYATIGDVIADRQAHPTDDLISTLLHSEVDGARIDPEMVQGSIAGIIGAGADSTASFLANVFDHLDTHPELRDAVVASPEALRLACEEFLRYFTPVQLLGRSASEDTEIAGHCIKKFDRVSLPWAAANHDPAEFANPSEVQLDRSPNRHLAFGFGIHRCLGASLARVEFNCTLSAVLRRMGDYRIDRAASRRYESIGIVNGWETLQADFTPGPRVTG